MTTVWRPRVRIPVPDIDDADARRESERRVDDEGHEAEESPSTKGPCEHGVKTRSTCKVCSACPHGRRRSRVQGVRWCINLRPRSYTLSVQGVRWWINLRARSSALSVQGVRWGINLRARSCALSVQGVRWVTICEHGRRRTDARSAVGHKYASTVVCALCARSARSSDVSSNEHLLNKMLHDHLSPPSSFCLSASR